MPFQELVIVAHDQVGGRVLAANKKTAQSARSKSFWSKKRSPTGHRISLNAKKPSLPKPISAVPVKSTQLVKSVKQQQQHQSKDDEEPDWYVCDTPSGPRVVWKNQAITLRRAFLENKSLQPVGVPTVYKKPEETIFVTRDYVTQFLMPRLYPEDKSVIGYGTKSLSPEKRAFPNTAAQLTVFKFAIKNGAEALSKGHVKRATASLEQAFRYLDDILRTDDWYRSAIFTESLIHATIFQAPQICHMVLKYIAAMVGIIHTPFHPMAVWARNLLSIIDTDPSAILAALAKAWTNAMTDTLGYEDDWVLTALLTEYELTFQLRWDSGAVCDARNRYHTLLAQCAKNSNPRHSAMNCAGSYCEVLMRFGEWEAAEELLSFAPEVLDEYIINEYKPGEENPAGLRITMIIMCMTQLGKILRMQGKYQQARDIYERAIPAATHYLGRDSPTTIEAIAYYGDCLKAQNLDEEAQAMYADADERMSPYMLGPLKTESIGT